MPDAQSYMATQITGQYNLEKREQEKINSERAKYSSDPTLARNMVAKLLLPHVLPDKKISTAKHVDKFAATVDALPSHDPRRGLGDAIIKDFNFLSSKEKFHKYRPQELILASYQKRFGEIKNQIHEYSWKQKGGFFGKFKGEKNVELPGQAEWEAEYGGHKYIPFYSSAALGGGLSAGWHYGLKPGLKGVAKYKGMRGITRLFGSRLAKSKSPGMAIAGAALMAIPDFLAFEWGAHKVQDLVDSDWAKDNPGQVAVASAIVGTGTAMAFHRIARPLFTKAAKKFMGASEATKAAGATAAKDPSAENLMGLKDAAAYEARQKTNFYDKAKQAAGIVDSDVGMDVIKGKIILDRARQNLTTILEDKNLISSVASKQARKEALQSHVAKQKSKLMKREFRKESKKITKLDKVSKRPYSESGKLIDVGETQLEKAAAIIERHSPLERTPLLYGKSGKPINYKFSDIEDKSRIIIKTTPTARAAAVQKVGKEEAAIKQKFDVSKQKRVRNIGAKTKAGLLDLGYTEDAISKMTYENGRKLIKAQKVAVVNQEVQQKLNKTLASIESKPAFADMKTTIENVYKTPAEAIPEFANTIDAVEFGMGASPKQVELLVAKKNVITKEIQRFKKAKDYQGHATAAGKVGLVNEAIQSSQGKRFLIESGIKKILTEVESVVKKDLSKEASQFNRQRLLSVLRVGNEAEKKQARKLLDTFQVVPKNVKASITPEANATKNTEEALVQSAIAKLMGGKIKEATKLIEESSIFVEEEASLIKEVLKEGGTKKELKDLGLAILAATSLIPLVEYLSPRQAEAGTVDMAGRFVTKQIGNMIKKAASKDVSVLLNEMKALNMIPKKSVDPYVLNEPMQSIKVVPTIKDIIQKNNLNPTLQRLVSPIISATSYFKNFENPIVQWANAQTSAAVNTKNALEVTKKTLEGVRHYTKRYKDVIKVMEPITEKYFKPLQVRNYHASSFQYYKKQMDKLWKTALRQEKFGATSEKKQELMKTMEVLEGRLNEHKKILVKSKGLADRYKTEWTATVSKMAAKEEYAGVRIFLAAEDTAEFTHYPFLKNLLSRDEKLAVARIKDAMELTGVRVAETGEKIILDRPFMHHAFHPTADFKAITNEVKDFNNYIDYIPPMAKLHSRAQGMLPMVPDAEYSLLKYYPDINVRIEALNFWKYDQKGGWWAVKETDVVKNHEGLRKFFQSFEDGFKPYEKTGVSKYAERIYAFEVARLLFMSPSVAFKHALKVVADLRIFGVEGVKAMPQAFRSVSKLAIKRHGGEEMLKKWGIKLDSMDEAVEAMTEQGKMYKVISDISPFHLSDSKWDLFLDNVNKVGSIPVAAVERFDRAMSVVVASKMAAKKGMTPSQAVYGFYDTILKTNFLSGPLNPAWLRNPNIRMMFTFQGTPWKILEQRAQLYGKAGKDVGNLAKQLRQDIKKGEWDFKASLIKSALTSEKDIFGTSYTKQVMRDLLLIGTAISLGRQVLDIDLAHHFIHLPFVKLNDREIAAGASPLATSTYRSVQSWFKTEEEDREFPLTTFFKEWFGRSNRGAPIPVNFKKLYRLQQQDIPERYKNSAFKYFFGIPAAGEH